MPNPTPKKKLPDDVRSLARSYTHMGVKVLAGIAENGVNESARVAAVIHLLDRGWGKPEQVHSGDGEGGPIRVIIRQLIETIDKDAAVKTIEHDADESLSRD